MNGILLYVNGVLHDVYYNEFVAMNNYVRLANLYGEENVRVCREGKNDESIKS